MSEATPPSQSASEGRQPSALVLVVHHQGPHPERMIATVIVVAIVKVIPVVVVALAADVVGKSA